MRIPLRLGPLRPGDILQTGQVLVIRPGPAHSALRMAALALLQNGLGCAWLSSSGNHCRKIWCSEKRDAGGTALLAVDKATVDGSSEWPKQALQPVRIYRLHMRAGDHDVLTERRLDSHVQGSPETELLGRDVHDPCPVLLRDFNRGVLRAGIHQDHLDRSRKV